MTQMKITKRFEISYSHFLPNHKGKCADLHGHNAVVELTFGMDIGSFVGYQHSGMVLDFGDIKELFENEIKEKFDHKHLNDVVDLEPPTAENLCLEIESIVMNNIVEVDENARLLSVTVWEDRDSCATLEKE